MKYLLTGLLYLLISNVLVAQKDKQFWFAAPYVSKQHGNLPINLQIATYEEAAFVEISIPANKNFKTIQRNIPPFTPFQLNLDRIAEDIINEDYNTIANKGILITASSYVSASYEVLGFSEGDNRTVNSDIFALKGRNALGEKFLTPYQTSRPNESKNLGDAYSAFHIVTTENNTLVTITPTKDLYGHKAGQPFSITLNKGQTYSCRALGKTGIAHPAGTEISSNHPIAVTVTDDSVVENAAYDLLGDQIVPIKYLGQEYIIPKMDSSSINYIYILGTEDNTEVIINKQDTLHLSYGQTIEYELTNSGTYVESNHPVYVWHLGSLFNEIAAAILPQVECTGSKSSVFTRKSLETFGLVLVTKSNSVGNFQLNGNSNLIQASDFKDVTGNPDYKVCFKLFSLDEIKLNQVYNITNSISDFHLGIIAADNFGSFRYGYFSNFSHLNLGPDQDFCLGGNTVLDAGPDNDSYLWNTGETTQVINVNKNGNYSVIVKKGSCVTQDSVFINVHELPAFDLGPDIWVCEDEKITINGPSGNYQYQWSTNENTQLITPDRNGLFSLEISDSFNCKSSDSINVKLHPLPTPTIEFENNDKVLCDSPIMTIKTEQNYKNILWSNGDTTSSTIVPINNTYFVEVKDSNNCSGSTERILDCSPFITIYNLCTPNQDGKNDYFIIEGMHNQMYNLEVFNRWGARVYHQEKYNNDWSPTNLQEGIYYYSLKHSEKDLYFKNWLQIIR